MEWLGEEAKISYQLWLSANIDDLFNSMCCSKNPFKYVKRQFINEEKLIKGDKFVDACVSGGKDLF